MLKYVCFGLSHYIRHGIMGVLLLCSLNRGDRGQKLLGISSYCPRTPLIRPFTWYQANCTQTQQVGKSELHTPAALTDTVGGKHSQQLLLTFSKNKKKATPRTEEKNLTRKPHSTSAICGTYHACRPGLFLKEFPVVAYTLSLM